MSILHYLSLMPVDPLISIILLHIKTLTVLWELLEKFSIPALQQIGLGIEQLWISTIVNVGLSVNLSESLPQPRSSLVTELTVENQDGVLLHVLPNGVHVAQKETLQVLGTLHVQGILDVTCLEFIAISRINDHVWMLLALNQTSKCLTTDRIHMALMGLTVV